VKKASRKASEDDLRPQYDLSRLKGGVRGKYYQQAMAGTNLVLIEPDLARAFPDGESVNRVLRIVLSAADAARGSFRPQAGKRTRSHKRARRKQAV
jgi:hypothetical protein